MFGLSNFDLYLTNGFFLGLLIPVCISLSYVVYLAGKGSGRLLWGLFVLRCLAFVLLLMLMMEPILTLTQRIHRKPLVAFLIDDSQSMGIEENGRLRKDILQDILESETFTGLINVARVGFFRFSDMLYPMSEGELDSLRFDGQATDLSSAVDALREQTLGEGLVAAVLLSDGAHNLGEHPERAVLDLRVPIVAVGIGNPEPSMDVGMFSAVIDPVGYVGKQLSISVGFKVSGFDSYQGLVVVEEGSERLVQKPVTLFRGEQRVPLKLLPKRPGRHVYRVSITSPEVEHSLENNALIVSTEIRENRVRILMVGGSPSSDLAYLRRVLGTDPDFELEVVTLIRQGEETSKIQERLGEVGDWDLVILIDLPGFLLTGSLEQTLIRFVEDGKALLVIGGGAAFNENYARSPLAKVLPMDFSGKQNSFQLVPFKVEIPKRAYQHPIFRNSDGLLTDKSEWNTLPPLLAYNRVIGIQTGADALIFHPTEMSDKTKMPLVTVLKTGKSKTMAVGFRTFWRFNLMMRGIGNTDRVSKMFWMNSIRWLVAREDFARVQVVVDKPTYRMGEQITFFTKVFNEFMQPQPGAQVRVELGDEGHHILLQDEGEGRYTGKMGGFPPGDYAYRVVAVKGGIDFGMVTGNITIGHYSLEYEDIRMDAELLQDLASLNGGAFVRPNTFSSGIRALKFSPQLVELFPKYRFWGQLWPFFLLVFLLVTEWTIRRRRGMV